MASHDGGDGHRPLVQSAEERRPHTSASRALSASSKAGVNPTASFSRLPVGRSVGRSDGHRK